MKSNLNISPTFFTHDKTVNLLKKIKSQTEKAEHKHIFKVQRNKKHTEHQRNSKTEEARLFRINRKRHSDLLLLTCGEAPDHTEKNSHAKKSMTFPHQPKAPLRPTPPHLW